MAEGVEIPMEALTADTLRGLIEAFVLREGTDYGEREAALDTKVEHVMRQLKQREAKIVFDPEDETCSIVTIPFGERGRSN